MSTAHGTRPFPIQNIDPCPSIQIYAQARDQLEGDGQDIPHQVFILRGGFQDFQAKYREDPELVENWSKEVWGSDWS